MYVSAFVLKRIKDAYKISNPDDDGIPILQIDESRIERLKLKWPRFCERQQLEIFLERKGSVIGFVIPYKAYDHDEQNINEFIDDLGEFNSQTFIEKYSENPPHWYMKQIEHLFLFND